jgi:hypothetical protein
MHLSVLIDEIASQADEFLAGATDRKQGRAGIGEFITMEHPDFDPATRKQVVDGVMAVLEAEEFFGTEFVGDPFASDEKEAEG